MSDSPDSLENNAGDPLLSEFAEIGTRIKIVAVGGAGINAIETLNLHDFPNVKKAAVNTDAASLRNSKMPERVLIGRGITRGLSAGGDAALARKAAESNCGDIARVVENNDLIFLVAGLGRGTGSGAAALIADIAASKGAMVIAFVTMPFSFEGGQIAEQATVAFDELRLRCEAVIPLYNDSLMQVVDAEETALNAFAQADRWIQRGISSLCAAILKTGLINVDFAALRAAFPIRGGHTLYSLGSGTGPDAAQNAVEELLGSPLLRAQESVRGAETLVIHIAGGTALTLAKANDIVTRISGKLGGRNTIMLGVNIEPAMNDALDICVIGSAGGFKQRPGAFLEPPRKIEDLLPRGNDAQTPGSDPSKTPENRAGKRVQTELGLDEMEAQRRFFDKTRPSMLDGHPIDTPTYIRRGIKIVL